MTRFVNAVHNVSLIINLLPFNKEKCIIIYVVGCFDESIMKEISEVIAEVSTMLVGNMISCDHFLSS